MLRRDMLSLDFFPQIPSSPLFPRCLWRGFALNHFHEAGTPESFITQDISSLDLDQALLQIYPKMSFPELARLHQLLKNENLAASFEKIVSAYGFGFDQRLLQSFELYLQLSKPLQAWVERHSLSPRDLLPLAALDFEWPHALFELLATADISRNYGAQIIELLVENLLLENPADQLAPDRLPLTLDGVPAWIEKLKRLRFPITAKLDTDKQDKLMSLPWTKDFQTRWQRKGDHSGLEVRFTISSKNDFQEKLKSLTRVLENCDD